MAQFIVEIMSNQIGSNKINGKIFILISGLVCKNSQKIDGLFFICLVCHSLSFDTHLELVTTS